MSEINYFIERKHDLMKFFNRLMKPGKKVIIKRYGVETGEAMVSDFRSEFESLIPEMPKIRQEDKLLEKQLILCTVYLAIYRSMKKQDKSVEDVWQLCHDIEEAMIKSIPGIIRWFVKRNIFSKKEINREIRSAEEFLPYICKTDYIFSENFGYTLIRTKTLAEGHDICDFRFKK